MVSFSTKVKGSNTLLMSFTNGTDINPYSVLILVRTRNDPLWPPITIGGSTLRSTSSAKVAKTMPTRSEGPHRSKSSTCTTMMMSWPTCL